MKEHPILFSAPMVRALLDGGKTQTRRALNPQPVWVPNWGMLGAWRVGSPAGMGLSDRGDHWSATLDDETIRRYATAEAYGWGARAGCPYGQPGDQLWVRETFSKIIGQTAGWIETDYKATYKHGDRMGDLMGVKKKWTPSIHMPRDASRITLEVTGMRVERLQEINEADAIAEGIDPNAWPEEFRRKGDEARSEYRDLWESINGPGSWAENPWVWVVEFTRGKV